MKEDTIILKKYDKDVWNTNEDFRKEFNLYFNKEEIKNRTITQAKGFLSSTASDHISEDWILNSKYLKPIINWIEKEILESTKYFLNIEYKNIYPSRIFINKMYKNSSADWHSHTVSGLVGVFYLNAPENSGELLTKNKKIRVKTGDLIIHQPELKHAVSKHLIEEPRISLVYEACFD